MIENFTFLALLVLVFSSLLLSGCQQEVPILIKKDVCRQPGSYCHTFNVDGGVMNISFPGVDNGTFNYSVEV